MMFLEVEELDFVLAIISELDTRGQVSHFLEPLGLMAPGPFPSINCFIDDYMPPNLGATRCVCVIYFLFVIGDQQIKMKKVLLVWVRNIPAFSLMGHRLQKLI